MSKTKAQLVEEALEFGIKNGDDIPYGQLEKMIKDIKSGGALAAAEGDKKQLPKKTKITVSQVDSVHQNISVNVGSSKRGTNTATVGKDALKAANSGQYYNPSGIPEALLSPAQVRLGYFVEVFKTANRQWYWHLRASNGQIVADSGEGYATKWGCKRAFKKFIGLIY